MDDISGIFFCNPALLSPFFLSWFPLPPSGTCRCGAGATAPIVGGKHPPPPLPLSFFSFFFSFPEEPSPPEARKQTESFSPPSFPFSPPVAVKDEVVGEGRAFDLERPLSFLFFSSLSF